MIKIPTVPLAERPRKIIVKYGYDPNEFHFDIMINVLSKTSNFKEWYEIEDAWVDSRHARKLYQELRSAFEVGEVDV